jgi:neutral ceramidase
VTTSISSAHVDITPSTMLEMGGYYMPNGPRLATGTNSPLMARAIAIWDPTPHVVVTLDAGTLPSQWHQNLRPRLTALGLLSKDFVLHCTHTHNAPMTLAHPDPYITYNATDLSGATAYWSELADVVVNLVNVVLSAPQIPVTLDFQSITQSWSASRTQPPTYKWTSVPVLTARDMSGYPRAVLFGFGCHAVTAGLQTYWDGDYPAAACSVIEAGTPACHAQFIPGPGGDQDPPWPRNWLVRNKLGTQLGSAVVTAMNTVGRPLTGSITSSLTSVAVPLDVPANQAERNARKAELLLRTGANAHLYANALYYLRHAPIAVSRIETNTDESVVIVPIQVWKIGNPAQPDLRMLFMGGEPVSGFGVWAETHYGGPSRIMFGGYANEVTCYVVGNTFFKPVDTNGSYEGGYNTLDEKCAGESTCIYGWTWHFKPGLDPGCAEPVIINALTAALA